MDWWQARRAVWDFWDGGWGNGIWKRCSSGWTRRGANSAPPIEGVIADAIERGTAYLAAGADMVFVEGPTSVEEVRRICAEIRGPVFYNMTGVSPRFTLAQMQDMGVSICITALTLVRASLLAMHDIAVRLRDEGPMADVDVIGRFDKHGIGNLHSFSGFDEVRRLEEAFLPKEELEKYSDSIGHVPKAG